MLFSRRYSTWQLVNHSQLLLVLRNCGPFSLMVPARHNGSPSHITQRQCISNGNILKKNTTDSTISITHRRISCNAGRDRDIKVPNASLACYLFSTVKQMGSVGSTFSYCRGFHSSTVGMNTQGPELGKDASEPDKLTELTVGERVIQFIGWLGGFYSRKAVLTRSSKLFYESCIDSVKTEEFFKALKLPDTFQSWFLVAHLHLWLCLVRLKREGKDGQFMIRELVSTFWEDVKQRMRMLGVHSSSVASRSMRELEQEFYGIIIAYEEGLLSDDRTLAAAIWRNLIVDKAQTDPIQLARMVEYIRKQVHHMDSIESQQILNIGSVTLLPFTGSTEQ